SPRFDELLAHGFPKCNEHGTDSVNIHSARGRVPVGKETALGRSQAIVDHLHDGGVGDNGPSSALLRHRRSPYESPEGRLAIRVEEITYRRWYAARRQLCWQHAFHLGQQLSDKASRQRFGAVHSQELFPLHVSVVGYKCVDHDRKSDASTAR